MNQPALAYAVKIFKGASNCMHRIRLLEDCIGQLESGNEFKKKKTKRTKFYLQTASSLTVAESQKKIEEDERERQRETLPRPHRPQKCTNCGVLGHNRHQCTSK